MSGFPIDPSAQPLELVTFQPPERRVRRDARFAAPDERRDRYHLPESLSSSSPVGYRTRIALTQEEGREALGLLSLPRPATFVPGPVPSEAEIFEEGAVGLMIARQSTNYRGQRAVLLGPGDSARAAGLLRGLKHLEAPVLDGAGHTWLVLSRPYQTAFTVLLTFVGHAPVQNLVTVPLRAWRKKTQGVTDIPTIGYLPDIHLGVLADGMERAAVLASGGRRQANVLQGPWSSPERRRENQEATRALEALCGLDAAARSEGWRLATVVQVGTTPEPIPIRPQTCRKVAANLLAFRSERIQPGVNAEDKAPAAYQERQDMEVPDALTVQAGRAAYNAFAHWAGCSRDQAKALLLMDRVDVLTPGGKERLRAIRTELEEITDRVVDGLPLWADLATGRQLSRNLARGKKAFALTGQRIYIGGLSRPAIDQSGLCWGLALRAFGAAAARGALVAELMGVVDLPPDCDLLAGICLMAGPVNQNDIGKSWQGRLDLLAQTHPDATSLLIWTMKAKTVADPIGNEEQLLNPRRKGALVDLRPGPHEVISLRQGERLVPLRRRDGRTNQERAFGDLGNFVTDPEGREIPGNRGSPWPRVWAEAPAWEQDHG